MNADYFKTMFDYQYWCRDRLLAAADGMTDEELAKPNGFTHGSILGILAHWIMVEFNWYQRLYDRPIDPETAPNPNTIKTMAQLQSYWQASEASWRSYLDQKDDPDREYVLRGRGKSGAPRTWKVWELLTMITTHAKQHTSEVAEALTMIGRSPGDLDFPVFLRSLES